MKTDTKQHASDKGGNAIAQMTIYITPMAAAKDATAMESDKRAAAYVYFDRLRTEGDGKKLAEAAKCMTGLIFKELEKDQKGDYNKITRLTTTLWFLGDMSAVPDLQVASGQATAIARSFQASQKKEADHWYGVVQYLFETSNILTQVNILKAFYSKAKKNDDAD